MKPTRLLTRDEFSACFAEPMQDVTASAEAAVDVWPYVDAIVMPLGIKVYDVVSVYRSAAGQLEHILIGTNRNEFFLVLIVDHAAREVHGHHLLDLVAEYSL